MKRILQKIALTGMVLSSAVVVASAAIKLPNLFSSHMVLQRDLPVPIFGTADPGEKVSVMFAGQTAETTADKSGQWMVKLTPLQTAKTGQEMVVKGSNTITLTDILVGEVWLASGQSNMAGKFVKSKGRRIGPKDLKRDHSGFRFWNKNGAWKTLDEKSQGQCSRVGYYFAMKLYVELDIPIGMIQCASSGTPIQGWMEESVAEEIRNELGIPAHWRDPKHPDRAHVQYDTWIKPILPVTFRGVIWYQGERNAKTQTGWEYKALLPKLINSWRETWAAKAGTPMRKFPFYYVQVPSQAEGVEYPWLRDSMRRVLDTTENTGMAIFYDHGPSLHPENKKPSGERLALWALAKDYGKTKLVHCGPLLDAVAINGNTASLSFKHVGGGLKNVSGKKDLRFFEIAGKDAKYVPAKAWIEGDTVMVQSDEISAPTYVRYLFWKGEPNAEVSLINAEGIPASSFITDDLKPPREVLQKISPEELAAMKKKAAENKLKKKKMPPTKRGNRN